MARLFVIECKGFGYSIVDSEELGYMREDKEEYRIIKRFYDIEEARNYLDELEGKLMQGRCIGNELI